MKSKKRTLTYGETTTPQVYQVEVFTRCLAKSRFHITAETPEEAKAMALESMGERKGPTKFDILESGLDEVDVEDVKLEVISDGFEVGDCLSYSLDQDRSIIAKVLGIGTDCYGDVYVDVERANGMLDQFRVSSLGYGRARRITGEEFELAQQAFSDSPRALLDHAIAKLGITHAQLKASAQASALKDAPSEA